MVDRLNQDERKLPNLNFNINLLLNFPISEIQDIADKFAIECANNKITKTDQMKKFFYELLELKNENEFNEFMASSRKYTKELIRDRLKNKNKSDNLSELMSKKIRSYLK
jgi:hypothetical protein